MSTAEKSTALEQARADADEVIRLASEGKRVTDPGLLRRLRERGDQVRQEMFAKHGSTDVAVELIREARAE